MRVRERKKDIKNKTPEGKRGGGEEKRGSIKRGVEGPDRFKAVPLHRVADPGVLNPDPACQNKQESDPNLKKTRIQILPNSDLIYISPFTFFFRQSILILYYHLSTARKV